MVDHEPQNGEGGLKKNCMVNGDYIIVKVDQNIIMVDQKMVMMQRNMDIIT